MTTPRDPYVSSDDIERAREAVRARIAQRQHRRVVRRTTIGALAGITAVVAVVAVVGFGLPSHSAPTTLAVQSPPISPSAPTSFPPPTNAALAYLASRTQVPLEGPTILPTNPLNPKPDHVELSATVTPSPDKYFVQLNGCAKAYPLNSPAINGPNCGGLAQDFGDFGGQSFTTPAAARKSLARIGFGSSSVPAGCSSGASQSVNLGDGVMGRVFLAANDPCLTWTQGAWSFYSSGGLPESDLITEARPLVEYSQANPPGTIGLMNEISGGDGQHTTTAWTVGDDDYTAGNYHSAIGALQLAASMQPAALAPRPTPTPTKQVTGSIHLATTTGAAGQPISGDLVIDNFTGSTATIGDGCKGDAFAVFLEGHGVDPDPDGSLDLCTSPFRVRAGKTTYPITVPTTYSLCGGAEAAGVKDIPLCDASGTAPPLPLGKYQAILVTNDVTIHDVASVPVTLVPAHS